MKGYEMIKENVLTIPANRRQLKQHFDDAPEQVREYFSDLPVSLRISRLMSHSPTSFSV